MGTVEGNKIIAAFMGYKEGVGQYHGGMVDKNGNATYPCLVAPNGDKITHVYYNTKWDWLMPVVQKIQDIDIMPPPNYTGYRIEIVVQGYVKIEGRGMPPIFTNVSIEGSLIAAVWKATVKFITWYNTTPK